MTRRSRARGSALLAGAMCLMASGCKQHFFWGALDPTVRALCGNHEDEAVLSARPLLGLVLDGAAPDDGAGARVLRVLRETAAEKAGLKPGDRVVRLGARRVRTNADLVAAVRVRAPGQELEVTAARDGGERRATVELGDWWTHDERVRRWIRQAYSDRAEFATGFYHGVAVQIDPADWLTWRGQRLRAPYVVYDDDDVLPFLGVFSLFRIESAPAIDAWRFTLLFFPLHFGSSGDGTDDDYLQDLLEQGEELHEVI